MKGFFVSLGALFEKHGATQIGILTNKSHYKETRSFEYLNFPAKLYLSERVTSLVLKTIDNMS